MLGAKTAQGALDACGLRTPGIDVVEGKRRMVGDGMYDGKQNYLAVYQKYEMAGKVPKARRGAKAANCAQALPADRGSIKQTTELSIQCEKETET